MEMRHDAAFTTCLQCPLSIHNPRLNDTRPTSKLQTDSKEPPWEPKNILWFQEFRFFLSSPVIYTFTAGSSTHAHCLLYKCRAFHLHSCLCHLAHPAVSSGNKYTQVLSQGRHVYHEGLPSVYSSSKYLLWALILYVLFAQNFPLQWQTPCTFQNALVIDIFLLKLYIKVKWQSLLISAFKSILVYPPPSLQPIFVQAMSPQKQKPLSYIFKFNNGLYISKFPSHTGNYFLMRCITHSTTLWKVTPIS